MEILQATFVTGMKVFFADPCEIHGSRKKGGPQFTASDDVAAFEKKLLRTFAEHFNQLLNFNNVTDMSSLNTAHVTWTMVEKTLRRHIVTQRFCASREIPQRLKIPILIFKK